MDIDIIVDRPTARPHGPQPHNLHSTYQVQQTDLTPATDLLFENRSAASTLVLCHKPAINRWNLNTARFSEIAVSVCADLHLELSSSHYRTRTRSSRPKEKQEAERYLLRMVGRCADVRRHTTNQ